VLTAPSAGGNRGARDKAAIGWAKPSATRPASVCFALKNEGP